MKKFKFALVDAFTDKALAGNPCAIVLGADKLTSSQMLAIAKEMNQSETAFLMKSKKSDLKARYFTPEKEIPLAGHPTIASIHYALQSKLIKNKKSISLELNDGPIIVDIEKQKSKTLIRMHQRKPIFGEIHNPNEVLPIFGLSKEDIGDYPIQTVSTGTRQLMIFVKSHEALKKVHMDCDAYRAYRSTKDFFSPHIFVLGGATKKGDTFAIHPGVAPDTSEDAFTGSATGGMAAYLYKHGFITKKKFTAEQGHWMNRPGSAVVQIVGESRDIESVSVAGTAKTVIEGILTL